MEYKGKRTLKFTDVFLMLSFLFVLGVVGGVEHGNSMSNMLWTIPVIVVDGIIVIIDNL